MTGLIIFFIIVFLLAAGFAWLADQPSSLLLIRFGGFEFAQENLAVIAALFVGAALVVIFLWIVIGTIWKTPGRFGSFFKTRRREKGWKAVAETVIAVGAGDTYAAKKSAKNSAKFLPEEPVTKLLEAQAAQMDGKFDVARTHFQEMLDKPETELVGLRGLYMEAESAGENEAARQFVEKAVSVQPGIEWSGNALLEMQAEQKDWEAALVTLQQNTNAKLYSKKEAKRLRAVLLTAHAMQLESSSPQEAKTKALEAHRLTPELAPAATTAARILSRLGDFRKASKLIEASWKIEPHPELMEAYIRVRSGDSGQDRLKKAQALNAIRANHPEGIMGLARAQMDLQDWAGARATLKGLAGSRATERVCLLMSEIEEGEYGDRGRMREWLSRAVRAPRDPVWTADGFIAESWAPVSPITGQIDAFEWRVPLEDLTKQDVADSDDTLASPLELPISGPNATTGAALIQAEPENLTYVKGSEEEIEPSEGGSIVLIDKEAQDIDPVEVEEKVSTQEPGSVELGEKVSDDDGKAAASLHVEKSTKPFPQTDVTMNGTAKPDEAVHAPETAIKAEKEAEKKTAEDDKPVDAEMQEDPINRGPLDDPGTVKAEETERKKFRLF